MSEARRERLQRFLARAGVESRRKAEELIREGRVTVNGEIAQVGATVDPQSDAVKLDGRRVHARSAHRYLLVNKPPGVMSTRSDPEGRPTVLALVPSTLRAGVKPVGRLDFQTEGLLLLTDDGDFAQRVSHPRYGCKKTYEVKVKGAPGAEELAKLRAGMVLAGKRTAPARVKTDRGLRGPRSAVANTWLTVELSEGRTRQIREMFFRIGHPVQRLRRVAIGPLRDPKLPLGSVRELTDEEVASLLGASPAAAKPKSRAGWARPGAARRKRESAAKKPKIAGQPRDGRGGRKPRGDGPARDRGEAGEASGGPPGGHRGDAPPAGRTKKSR